MTIFIAEALRTPRGRGNSRGGLKGLTPVQLLAQVARALPPQVRDVARDAVIGCVTQTAEQGGNLARLAMLEGGFPDSCAALTVNRFCTSSLSATVLAALRAEHDDAVMLAGGVEMMSRVGLGADHPPILEATELLAKHGIIGIGAAADHLAKVHGFTREACDAYALRSQQRAARALEAGHFRSIVPSAITHDECVRASLTLETLQRLPSAFGGVHTAGSAPAAADGAALVVLGTEGALARAGLRTRARIVAMAELGTNRSTALDGVVEASQLALKRAGLTVGDIDVFEVNEAFSAVMLLYTRALGLDDAKLNPNGGAIALGHPMGATGAVLIGMALDELERTRTRRALVAICGAAGLATALVLEATVPHAS